LRAMRLQDHILKYWEIPQYQERTSVVAGGHRKTGAQVGSLHPYKGEFWKLCAEFHGTNRFLVGLHEDAAQLVLWSLRGEGIERLRFDTVAQCLARNLDKLNNFIKNAVLVLPYGSNGWLAVGDLRECRHEFVLCQGQIILGKSRISNQICTSNSCTGISLRLPLSGDVVYLRRLLSSCCF